MDQLYPIGNNLFDYYLDLGVFEQDQEKNWRFLPRWSDDLIKKVILAPKILGPDSYYQPNWVTKY